LRMKDHGQERLASGGLVTQVCARLAARQGLGRHGGKQGRRNGAAKVSNTGDASHVRARGRVCVHGFVLVLTAKCGGEPKLSGTRHRNGRERTQAASKGARVEEGSNTCKATGSARWPALKRQRVYTTA
jgi:hypothetical protein